MPEWQVLISLTQLRSMKRVLTSKLGPPDHTQTSLSETEWKGCNWFVKGIWRNQRLRETTYFVFGFRIRTNKTKGSRNRRERARAMSQNHGPRKPITDDTDGRKHNGNGTSVLSFLGDNEAAGLGPFQSKVLCLDSDGMKFSAREPGLAWHVKRLPSVLCTIANAY
jgi:hypothetical protein